MIVSYDAELAILRIEGDEDRTTSGRRRRAFSAALNATRDVIVDLSDMLDDVGLFTPEDIEKRADVQDGDILFIHTGWHRYSFFGEEEDEERYIQRHPGPHYSICDWLIKKKIHIWGVDCISTDHPMNLPIGRFLGKGAQGHCDRVRAACEAKFGGPDGVAALFPDSAYQLTHNALFPSNCMHIENMGGDINAPELQNQRLILGIFPWKFRGGEAAFEHGEAARFTGEVWLRAGPAGPDGTNVGIVHFAPRARTHWHAHPGGQFLYGVTGRGWIRSRDDEGAWLEPGDVLWVPAGEWHFHSAGPDTPLVHVAGLFRVLQCVADGRSFALLERFTVDGWLDLVRRHQPATASLVPAALRMVLEADVDPADLGSIRSVVSGTAPLSAADADKWRQATRGRFCQYQGAGSHDVMLDERHLTDNARLIADLLDPRA